MPKIGTLVRVGDYPEFAAGRTGRIIEHEGGDRWLVQLDKISTLGGDELVILSLQESEFTLVDTGLKEFLYPRSRYYGSVKPENLVFNSNLQEFALRVSYIASLETNGKLSPLEAYEQAKLLWEQLEKSKNNLGIGEDPFNDQKG